MVVFQVLAAVQRFSHVTPAPHVLTTHKIISMCQPRPDGSLFTKHQNYNNGLYCLSPQR